MIVQGVAGLTVKMTFWVLPGATLPGLGWECGVWCVKVVCMKIIRMAKET